MGHGSGRRPQVFQKQASKVPRSDSKTFRESLHSTVLQTRLTDQPQCPRNRVGGSRPGWSAGRGFRPATQTGAKTRLRCSRGTGEVMDIFLFRSRRRANRTAVHSATVHADKEFAVKPRIARQPSSRADLPIQSHLSPRLMIVEPAGKTGRFRTPFPRTIFLPETHAGLKA
jgi:hypothetical protein